MSPAQRAAPAAAEASGYPERARTTPVPDLLFSRDLPALEDPLAVKLLLHLLWRLHRRDRGRPPLLRMDELRADPLLRRGAAALGEPAGRLDARIDEALEALHGAGLALSARVAGTQGEGPRTWITLADAAGRRTMARLAEDDLLLPDLPRPVVRPVATAEADADAAARVIALYEDNLGLVTPLIAEELADAAERYPMTWIEDAFREALANNARSWAYARAILERWAREGRDEEEDEADRRAHRDRGRRDRAGRGPYEDWIER